MALDVLSDAEVAGTQAGTTENAVCSNRGTCDEVNGVCRCYIQWGSSNAANGFGGRGDCGHVEPYLPMHMVAEDKRALELREIERRAAERSQSTATKRGFEHFEAARRRRGISEDRIWTDHGFTKYSWAQGQVRGVPLFDVNDDVLLQYRARAWSCPYLLCEFTMGNRAG